MMKVYKYLATFNDGTKDFDYSFELNDKDVENANSIFTADDYAADIAKHRGWSHISTHVPLDKEDLKDLEEQYQR